MANRNKVLHGEHAVSPLMVLCKIKQKVSHIVNCFKPKTEDTVREKNYLEMMGITVNPIVITKGDWVAWFAPPQGHMKLNLDASWNHGNATIGGSFVTVIVMPRLPIMLLALLVHLSMLKQTLYFLNYPQSVLKPQLYSFGR